MSSQRLGIFGGTFDPIHVGHLYAANVVLVQERLDRVLFLPVGDPAHRATHAPPEDRMEMARLAIADNIGFAVDDTALRQPGPVYTADTLPLLRKRFPNAAFSFIAGTDSLVRSTWRRLNEVIEALERFSVLNVPLVDVSASAIRAAIAEGRPVRYLVTDPVLEYIEQRKLYRAQ